MELVSRFLAFLFEFVRLDPFRVAACLIAIPVGVASTFLDIRPFDFAGCAGLLLISCGSLMNLTREHHALSGTKWSPQMIPAERNSVVAAAILFIGVSGLVLFLGSMFFLEVRLVLPQLAAIAAAVVVAFGLIFWFRARQSW